MTNLDPQQQPLPINQNPSVGSSGGPIATPNSGGQTSRRTYKRRSAQVQQPADPAKLIDPLILELIGKLPAPGAKFDTNTRKRWLGTFESVLELVYGLPDPPPPRA